MELSTAQIWVIVSHAEEDNGLPRYVSKNTEGSPDGEIPMWVEGPRDAKQFGSRRAANKFLGALEVYDGYAFVQNLGKYGFAG